MSVSFRHLSYVVAAAERGSITEASRELGVSQPAISAAIKGLEQAFGYRLFVRNPARGLSLTPSGRSFVKQARHLLDDVRNFEREAMGLGQQLTGVAHVGCYFITAPFLMPPVFGCLAEHHPDMSIVLHEGDMIEVVGQLKSGITDVALSYDSYPDPGVAYEPLFEVQPHVVLAADDPLARRKTLSLALLVDKPMVLLDLPVAHDYFQSLFTLHGLVPRIEYRLRTFELVRSMVGAGLGFSFGLLPIRTERTYDGNVLVQRPLEETLPRPKVCLVYPKQPHRTRIVEAFAAECRRAFAS